MERGGAGQYGTKFRVTWRDENGVERSANTRGTCWVTLTAAEPGDLINVIRDGRGSIIAATFAKKESK
jgi:hypothetical protein